MGEWKRFGDGSYGRRDGDAEGIVILDGELWVSTVFWLGELVDRGEWDGRGTAFRNAVSAMRRARALRNPTETASKDERTEAEDEDDEF